MICQIDNSARDELVTMHLHLVDVVVGALRPSLAVTRLGDEAQSIAREGLMLAAETFNSARGPFDRHAILVMQRRVLAELDRSWRNHSPVDNRWLDTQEADSGSDDVSDLLSKLTNRERLVIVLRFGLDGNPVMTIRQIALRENLNPRQAQRVLERAKRKMRA